MEPFLLLGLVGLFLYTLILSSRVKQLERQSGWAGDGEAAPDDPDPLFEPRPAAGPVAARAEPSAATMEPLVRPPEPFEPPEPEPEASAPVRETLGGFFERWVGG